MLVKKINERTFLHMEQNIIAVIWDFDKTLINGYMQEPLFEEYDINGSDFWKEVNSLPEKYRQKGVETNSDTIYLNHILTCVEQGLFNGLNNKKLKELGKQLKFYPGTLEIFKELKDVIKNDKRYQEFNITLEHYIVSTGLKAMIEGSDIYSLVDGVWGCSFIENPIRSDLETKVDMKEPENSVIKQIGYAIDNTSKTRALFEINKGTNKYKEIDVNSKIDDKDRRVPFENMIYIADGPSDIPAFSILKKNGGKTLGVYPKGNYDLFSQVDSLIRDGRIDMYVEADYSKDTAAYMWLMTNVKSIANKIYSKRKEDIANSASKPPRHITE